MKEKLLKALNRINRELPGKARYFCAVSGGVDSVVLLKTLKEYRDSFDPDREIVVLHVNHNLRGAESDRDEEFVRRLSGNWQLPFFCTKLPKGKKSQDALRKKRMEYFYSQLDEEDRLFLGHHLDDQAETLMFRLIRGVGLRGLAGMGEMDGRIIRPLLGFSKKDILQAAKEWELSWREDSSNRSTKYERNWIRLELIPLLESRRPNFSRRLAALAREASALPKAETPSCFESASGWKMYSAADLKDSDSGDLSRIFSLNRANSVKLHELIRKGSGQLHTKKRNFWISCGYLCVEPKKLTEAKVEKRDFSSELGKWRFPDGVELAQITGEKKKKLYQAEKIPVYLRDSIPIVKLKNRIQLALPVKKNPGFEFEPSVAGHWFFNSSGFPGNRAAVSSKERSQGPRPE